MNSIQLTDLPWLRLANQQISRQQFGRPEELVEWMGALQAQDYGQAVWAIGLRLRAARVSEASQATLATVEQAITDAKILRTWPMRGTIHFVPAQDAAWMLSLGAQRMIQADARRLRQLELDHAIINHCGEILQKALQAAPHKLLSRPATLQLLEDQGISTKGGRGYHIVWHLAQTGVLCIGPMLGKQQSFALLHEWAPGQRQLSREEALATLAGRYFTSHGPATVQDFAWWSGLTVADATLGLDGTSGTLQSTTVEGKVYWFASANFATVPPNPDTYLLPGFDEYLLGYKDRTAVLDVNHFQRIVPGSNGVFKPIIVTNGQVVGAWQRKIKPKAVGISLDYFDPHPADAQENAAKPALQAYASFLNLPLSA
jgi:hypothetical protein